jgi:hypothetical protein
VAKKYKKLLIYSSTVYTVFWPEEKIVESLSYLKQLALDYSKKSLTEEEWIDWSSDEHKKLNNFHSNFSIIKRFSHLPLVLKTSFTLFYNVLKSEELEDFLKYIDIIPVDNLMLVKDWIEVVKQQNVVFKHFGTRLNEYWENYIDWNTWSGYNMRSFFAGRDKEIFDWSQKPSPVGDGIPNFWKYYYQALMQFLDLGKYNTEIEDLTFWLSKVDTWAGSGSAQGVKTEVEKVSDGRTMKSKSTKVALALVKDLDEIKNEMFSDSTIEKYSGAIKIEAGRKDRIIISAGSVNQRRMGWLSSWFEPALKRSSIKETTLFMNNSEQVSWWNKLVDRMKLDYWCLPMDTASFDQGVSNKEIDIIFLGLLTKIVENKPLNWESARDMLILAWYHFYQSTILINGKNKTWKKGMPTGIRWTAFFDTVINICRSKVVFKLIQLDGNWSGDINLMAQGDDDSFDSLDVELLGKVFEKFNEIGVNVHPMKNYLDISRMEFLRKIASKQGVKGYIGRRILQQMFRDPTKRARLSGQEKLREIVSSWIILVSRGADKEKVFNLMYRDIRGWLRQNGIKIGEGEIFKLLVCPASLGGIGLNSQLLDKNVFIKQEESENSCEYKGKSGSYLTKQLNTETIIGEKVNINEFVVNSITPEKLPLYNKYVIKIERVDNPLRNIRIALPELTFRPNYRTYYRNWVGDERLEPVFWDKVVAVSVERGIDYLITVTKADRKQLTFELWKKCQRKVFWHWVKNKLPFHQPLHEHFADNVVSVVFTSFKDQLFDIIFNNHRVGWNEVLNAAIYCEQLTLNFLNNSRDNDFVIIGK